MYKAANSERGGGFRVQPKIRVRPFIQVFFACCFLWNLNSLSLRELKKSWKDIRGRFIKLRKDITNDGRLYTPGHMLIIPFPVLAGFK